jgi:hypothetical protein
MEEALRLSSLPGENEGRVYFFRRVYINGVPENGDRRVWLDACQKTLSDLARNAVHAGRSEAARADAVFFRSQGEACSALLSRVLLREPFQEWFWNNVSDSPFGASAATHVAGIIARLSRSESSWLSVASVVIQSDDPVRVLSFLPEGAVRRWLRELQWNTGTAHAPIAPAAIREASLQMIGRAAKTFGAEDPRVIWLATLAVILAAPSEMHNGLAVSRARAVVNAAALPHSLAPETREKHEIETGEPIAKLPAGPAAQNSSVEVSLPVLSTASVEATRTQPESGAVTQSCLALPTSGAGLYFLLNALRHLGIAKKNPSARFLAELFRHIAKRAGIPKDDPILLWTAATLEETDPEPIDMHQLLYWHRKLRRWCRRYGQIGLRAVIRRKGLVTLTRTDLDISLPLDAADIRIRRIGLDLNPGWVPWFGRVVRFHYLHRGEFHG